MAVGDIFYAQHACSTNNRNWTFGFYLKETVEYTGGDNLDPIATALFLVHAPALQAILAVDSFHESINVWKRHPGSARPAQILQSTGQGSRPGRSMSNDNCMYINLRQDTVNAKFNGGMYIAGQSENDQDNNRFDSTYLDGAVKAFTDTFEASLTVTGGFAGSFAFAILSKAFTPPTTTIGTAFEVFRAVANDRVATQRRRRQKVRGWAIP